MPPSTSSSSSKCIFCFKNSKKIGKRGQDGQQDEVSILHRFFTMVQRYFEEKTGFKSDFSSENVITTTATRNSLPAFLPVPVDLKFASCAECFQIVDSYCDIYHKMKCLELELDKVLDKLKTVMTCANDEKSLTTNRRRGKKETEKSMEFRQLFLKHCQLGSLELFPKLTLGRTKPSPVQGPVKKRGRPRKMMNVEPVTPTNSLANDHLSTKPPSISIFKITKSTVGNLDFELPSDMVLKSSPPGSPLHNEHFESDWLADNENPSSVEVEVTDVNCVTKVDNLCEQDEDDGDEAEYYPSGKDDDSDWLAEDDEQEIPKKRQKKAKQAKVRARKAPSGKLQAGRVYCQQCRIEPRPTFGSLRILQLHQNYLHTNGYMKLTKSDNSETLHLTESDLKLEGIDSTPKRCSESFPKCSKEFMLEDELKTHQKFHGSFTCETCGVVFNDAIEMVDHTIVHLGDAGKLYSENGALTCGKCTIYSTHLEGELVNHYLEFHMNMPIVLSTCPICHQIFKYVEKVPFLHYLNYHDLTRLEDSSSGGIQCTKESCSAYFLTEDQLQFHLISIHQEVAKHTRLGKTKTPVTKMDTIAMARRRKFMKYKTRDFIHECEYCPRKFRGVTELKAHVWSSHADMKLGIDCGKIQLTEDGLTIDEFVSGMKCVCWVCEKVLNSEEQLERHAKHHGEFKCNFCDVVKSLATELAVHETVHKLHDNEGASSTTSDSVNCPRCVFSTKNRLDYIDHHLQNHLNVPSDRKRCPICWKPAALLLKKGKGKAHRNWIINHFMEYHDKTDVDPDTMPKCSDCPAYFRTPVQLHNHSREIHGKQTIRECCDCGKIYRKTELLRAHRISAHKVDEVTFQFFCGFPGCNHKFERQIELDYHESNAHSERDAELQICPECGRTLVGTSQLANHLKGHETQARKEEARAQRKEIRMLNKMERRPEEPQTCVCDQCGKSFANKRLLQAHQKRHADPASWKHICPLCSKKCPTKYSLTKHSWMHSGEKHYKCKWCDKAFSNSTNRNIHQNSKHKNLEEMKVF